MKIVNAKEVHGGPNPHNVKAAQVYDSEHAMVVPLTRKPRQSLKRHVTPVDVSFYVLEGTGTFEVGDEKQTVGPDSLIDSPARIPHCWYNEGDQTLRLLMVKVPRPTEQTRLLWGDFVREFENDASSGRG